MTGEPLQRHGLVSSSRLRSGNARASGGWNQRRSPFSPAPPSLRHGVLVLCVGHHRHRARWRPLGPASTECLCSDPDSTRLDRECPTVGGLGLHMVPPTLFRPLVVQIGNPTGWRSSFLAGGVVSCSSRSMLSSLASPLGLAGSGLDIVVTSATLPIAWGGECAAVLAVLCVTLRRCVEGADLFSFGRVTLVVVVVMQRKFCTRCAGS